jgi:hypothetical protein
MLRKLYMEQCVWVHAETTSESSSEAVGSEAVPTPLGANAALTREFHLEDSVRVHVVAC